MKAPRRIFRRGGASGLGRIALALLAGSGLLALSGLYGPRVLHSLPLMAETPSLPRRVQVDSREIAVVGGDTLLLRGLVVRLAGIASPSRGARCSGGTDCGGEAATVLAGLVRDRRLDCRLQGQDSMGRPFAACDASGIDLSSAVVAGGWARVEEDSPALARLESEARRRGAGLWADAVTR